MTINATAMWLLGMYLALADEQGVAVREALGHDAERHPEGVPVARHVHLPARGVEAAHRRPHRVHGEARARRGTRSTCARTTCRKRARRRCRSSRTGSPTRSRCSTRCATRARFPPTSSPRSSGASRSSSTRASASSKRCARCARSREMWDRICAERYGVNDEKLRRFRYGMQVNSLGLTEEQPENNVQRIVLEMLGVTLSKDARARAVQLPCWNEALGLPTPWDQQWSLRIQQVLAYESDLLEYDDLFDGSMVVEAQGRGAVSRRPRPSCDWVLDGGGSFAMIDEMKGRLVQSARRTGAPHRVGRAEGRRRQLASPRPSRRRSPTIAQRGGIVTIDPDGRARAGRSDRAVARGARQRRGRRRARRGCARSRPPTENLVPATIELARAGGTVGEWAGALREVFGEYRAPTGVGAVAVRPGAEMEAVRERGARRSRREPGGPIRLLVGKPGLDGHSNGAEQIAVAARDAGHGGRLPGHPAHAGRDRGRGPRRGRRRGRPVDPLRLPPRPGARDRSRQLRDGRGRRAGRGRWHHPGRGPCASSRPWAWPGCTHPRTTGSPRSWATSPNWPGSTATTSPQAGADSPADEKLHGGSATRRRRRRRRGRARRRCRRRRDEHARRSRSSPASPV